MKKQDKIILGVATVSVVLAGIIYFVKRAKAKKEAENTIDVVDGAEPKNTASNPTKPALNLYPTIDKNKLLKKGSKGIEVKHLQKLLGVKQDGSFGSKTESKLMFLKGVKQISINSFHTTSKPIAIGTKIMAKANPTKLYTTQKQANGVYFNSGTIIKEVAFGKLVGTYAGKTGSGQILVKNSGVVYAVKNEDISFF